MNISTHVMNIILSLVLIPSVISIVGLPLLAYGQSASSSSSDINTIKKQTSGGTLDIILQSFQSFPKRLRVLFLIKGTDAVQPHTDYDITIKNSTWQTSIVYLRACRSTGNTASRSGRYRCNTLYSSRAWKLHYQCDCIWYTV